jgi:hypothetical protein
MLSYDLIEAGYMQEALGVAEQFVHLDPLSPAAHVRLFQSLYGVGHMDEALHALEVSTELGLPFEDWVRSGLAVVDGRDVEATAHLRASMEPIGLPSDTIRQFIVGGRDPDTGAAYLDEHIPMMMDLVPQEFQNQIRRNLINYYGFFAHYDRQFEIILESDINDSTWTAADDMIFMGNIFRFGGFTAHPKYLEVVKLMGIVELWEQRGPPDFCRKAGGEWVCE